MTFIYMVIVFSPLAPLAMQSKLVAHAVTGECSGDCKIDGCSLERSAAHTCCCAQKKLTQDPLAASPLKPRSCCAAKPDNEHNTENDSSASTNSSPKEKRSASIRSTPCGSGKLLALTSNETIQHLPYCSPESTYSPIQSTLFVHHPEGLTSRHGEPPDPPPIIS